MEFVGDMIEREWALRAGFKLDYCFNFDGLVSLARNKELGYKI